MGHKRNSSAYKTRRMAICAVLCALGVAIMGAGALVEVVDLTAAAAASLLLIPVLGGYGNGYAVMVYAVTGVLSLILMPQSMVSWLYLGLLGYYPILKVRLDRLRVPLAVLCKAILLIVVMALYLLAFYLIMMQGSGTLAEVFLAGFGDVGGASWIAWAVLILSFVTFFLYDVLLTRLVRLYCARWQSRVQRWMR